MDLPLPDEATFEKMREEYDKYISPRADLAAISRALCADRGESAPPEREERARFCDFGAGRFLFLYFAALLIYNIVYGTQIYDPHRGVGGFRPDVGAFGQLNGM